MSTTILATETTNDTMTSEEQFRRYCFPRRIHVQGEDAPLSFKMGGASVQGDQEISMFLIDLTDGPCLVVNGHRMSADDTYALFQDFTILRTATALDTRAQLRRGHAES